MRGLARLLTVSGMAAAVAVLVIHLERHYAPRLAEPGSISGHAADSVGADTSADIDAIVSADSWSHLTPIEDEVIAGLAAKLHWNDDASKRFWQQDAGGWETTLHATVASGPATAAPQEASSQAQASAQPIDAALSGPETPGSANVQPASSVEAAGRRTNEQSLETLRSVETMDLMRQLRETDGQATRARTELIRRGFTEVDIELARRLFDPDPAVRKRMARSLPGLRSVDAAVWLLPLCRDPDADVRMTAVTLMATTGDPGLLEQVEALARQDDDSRIRDLADQIAQQRSIAGSRGGPAAGTRFNASRGNMSR